MNLEKIKARAQIIKLIRQWFDTAGFIEMHTPRLVGLPGQEPHLEPFWTQLIAPSSNVECRMSNFDAALITSPEYAMKRLLAEGIEKIYDLGPCFRNNEPWDGTHDPEFLMLEWYRREAGLEEIMRDTEEMIRWVVDEFRNQTETNDIRHSAERIFDIRSPFRRMTVEQAWQKYAGIDLDPLLGNREALAQVCRAMGQTVNPDDTWDDLYFKIFLSEIEPKLSLFDQDAGRRTPDAGPVFLYRYPASMAALARRCADDPRWAERVEFYLGGLELANGFAELSDPAEQRKRFEEERALRSTLGKKTWPLDERFLSALPQMGNAAGIAFGVDRLVMLLTGSSSINDVLPFPARERFIIKT
jgi:lysyl-tRNA synthetase class 2